MTSDYDEFDMDLSTGEEIVLFFIALICLICLPFAYLIRGVSWCISKLREWAYAYEDHSL